MSQVLKPTLKSKLSFEIIVLYNSESFSTCANIEGDVRNINVLLVCSDYR
jgi:hypothetical protein